MRCRQRFERRYNHGLTFDVNYAWAHQVWITRSASAIFWEKEPTLFLRTHIVIGNSDLDVRNRFAFTANYEIPFGKSLTGASGVLAKGWQFNTLYAWATGIPFTVLNPSFVSGTNPTSHSGDRPNVTGNPRLANPTLSEWFNTLAFSTQPAGTLGDSPRNSIYGPRYLHLDLSLSKDFPLYEKLLARVPCGMFQHYEYIQLRRTGQYGR